MNELLELTIDMIKSLFTNIAYFVSVYQNSFAYRKLMEKNSVTDLKIIRSVKRGRNWR